MGWLKRRQLRTQIDERHLQLQASALEALDLSGTLIDPTDALRDPQTGQIWFALGGEKEASVGRAFGTEEQLRDARNEARWLALENEFAINGHENRVSYIVGTGHNYTAVADDDEGVSDEQLVAVQDVLDEFIKEAGWHKRQQEMRLRLDRDGEVFVRIFGAGTGEPALRFVEPADVSTPKYDRRKFATFGIVTDPDDVEMVQQYWIDGILVAADEVQHRKRGVDSNVKRGVPLMWPVRKNLNRAVTIQKAMATVAQIQAAIAMIRKHATGTTATVQMWAQSQADATLTNEATGKTTYFKQYAPGTILDGTQGIEYEFPANATDPSRFVLVLQSELRSIASRLVMPEFMLTSDASNANFSSTLVAEGPAVKFFQRLQWSTIEADLELFDMMLAGAVEAGRLDADVVDRVTIDVEPPRLESRNRKDEVDADVALVNAKMLSRRTGMIRHDLDPDTEEEQIEAEREAMDPFDGLDPFGNSALARVGQ